MREIALFYVNLRKLDRLCLHLVALNDVVHRERDLDALVRILVGEDFDRKEASIKDSCYNFCKLVCR